MHVRRRIGMGRGFVPWEVAVWLVLAAVVAVAFLARRASAQEVRSGGAVAVTGTVRGADGAPLVGAFVALEDSEWGSLTGDGGRFVLPRVPAGPVRIRAEHLGYRTLVWSGVVEPGMQALQLRLEAEPVLLEGLRVVTDRFRARRNATATSVLAYDEADLATAPQESVVRFLTTRVGLAPARCGSRFFTDLCFWSRGRVIRPVVYVDEVPMLGGLEYLETMRPHDLYMVEVYARGRHIRAYTHAFMLRAARDRLRPIALTF